MKKSVLLLSLAAIALSSIVLPFDVALGIALTVALLGTAVVSTMAVAFGVYTVLRKLVFMPLAHFIPARYMPLYRASFLEIPLLNRAQTQLSARFKKQRKGR